MPIYKPAAAISASLWNSRLSGLQLCDQPSRSTVSMHHRAKLRVSPEVIEHFESRGPGWQSRINAALQDWEAARYGRFAP
ncbi:BrnA antitoxin family protein [Novosphingobium gossypii]|uniref:BrnA antitoxin family protein n=1 Tax=Novosphingobium gossypii TaxID=1604774 RepID=UPI003D2594DC